MEILMKRITIAILVTIILVIGCAGNKTKIKRHRASAAEAYEADRFREASAHIDSASSLCKTIECKVQAHRWLLEVAKASGNDVLRAQAYKNLALTYMNKSIETDSSQKKAYSDSAYNIANRYLDWADSLNESRGDPFPLADALLLAAETSPPDSPGVAIANLLRLTFRPDTAKVPPNLQPYVSRAEKLLDELGREMALRLKIANQIFPENPEKAIGDYIYVYRAASAFNNAELASEVAMLITEFYRDAGKEEKAARWAGEALIWEPRKAKESNK